MAEFSFVERWDPVDAALCIFIEGRGHGYPYENLRDGPSEAEPLANLQDPLSIALMSEAGSSVLIRKRIENCVRLLLGESDAIKHESERSKELSKGIVRAVITIVNHWKLSIPDLSINSRIYPAFWFRYSYGIPEIPISSSFLQRYSQWRMQDAFGGLTLMYYRKNTLEEWRGRTIKTVEFGDVVGYTLDDIILGLPLEETSSAVEWSVKRLLLTRVSQSVDPIAAPTERIEKAAVDHSFLDPEANWPFPEKDNMPAPTRGMKKVVREEWDEDGSSFTPLIDDVTNEPEIFRTRSIEAVCGRKTLKLLNEVVSAAAKNRQIPSLSSRRRGERYECSITRLELVAKLKKLSLDLKKYSDSTLTKALSSIVACNKE